MDETPTEIIQQTLALITEAWNDGAEKHAIEVVFTPSTRGVSILLHALAERRIDMEPAAIARLRSAAAEGRWPSKARRTVRFFPREKWCINRLVTELINLPGAVQKIGVVHPQ